MDKIKSSLHLAVRSAIAMIVLFAILDLLGDTGVKIKAFIFNPVRSAQAMLGQGSSGS